MYGPRQWSWRGFQIDDATEIADSQTYGGASLGMRALDEYERRGRTTDDSSVLQGVWHSLPTYVTRRGSSMRRRRAAAAA